MKSTNIWKLGNIYHLTIKVQKASPMENKIYFDFNANKNKTSKNVWVSTEVMFKEKFVDIQTEE